MRWECGDVPGVTGPDLGQEYCEYHASAGGKLVSAAKDIPQGQKLSCVFTGVYADVKGTPAASATYATTLGSALADPANLGAAADPALTIMKVGFNSRGAATSLIHDCAANANGAPADEARQAACYQASLVNGPNQTKLAAACRGKVLTDDKQWAPVAAMGAKVAVPGDANFESQKDIVACLRTAAAKGVTWRNSDPMICTRVTRAVNECKVAFEPIPDAVDGFTFTGWTNRSIPAGCRYAKVNGKDYPNIVLCEASSAEVEDLDTNPQWSGNLQQFCHDRFANDLVMQAPIRALQTAGTQDGTFCTAYNSNWSPAKK